jgi:hypothetical protein
MVGDMRLYFAGIDLRYTPYGAWFCLEVYPSPGFTFYETETGQSIAAAPAKLLMQLDRAAQIYCCIPQRIEL